MKKLWLGLALALVLPACGGDGGTYVKIDFEQGTAPAQVARIHLDVTLGSGQAMAPLDLPGPITFPASKVLEIRHGEGAFMVTAIAYDGGNLEVARGTASGAVMRGETLPLTLRFGGSVDTDGGSADAATSSDGGMAMLTVDRTNHDFGTHVIGQVAPAVVVTVSNTGTATTGSLLVALGGGDAARFSISADTCGTTPLAPSMSCTLSVTFAPAAEAAATAELMISASPGGNVTVMLGGSGATPGALELTPATMDFGRFAPGATSPAVTFTGKNTGGTSTGTLMATLTGTDAARFAISSDTCSGTMLGAQQTCTLAVRFTPSQPGARAASLRLSASPGGTDIATLSGTGLTPAMLSLTPASNSYGDVEVGIPGTPRTVMVTNVGDLDTGALAVTNSNATEFPISGNTCAGAVLSMGQSCALVVGFTPSTGGARSASVTIAAGAATATFAASGRGMYRLTVTRDVRGTGTCTSCVVQSGDTPATIDCGATCSALFPPGATVTLTARQDNGSGRFFAGLSGAPCSLPRRSCAITVMGNLTVSARWEALAGSLMFISSSSVLPSLGGIVPYDAECNRIATMAGLNSGASDEYIAWMGTTTATPASRLAPTATNFVRLDNRVVAVDRAALTGNTILNPVLFDEQGRRVTGGYLTGLDAAGVASLGANCNDWSSSSTFNYGVFGLPSGGPGAWQSMYSANCDGQQAALYGHLLCVRKNGSGTTPLSPRTGKLLWITNSAFRIGTDGDPDAFCQRVAERPPGLDPTRARALIATTTRAAGARLLAGYEYVRPDGQLIGTRQELIDRTFTGGEWQSANGSYLIPESVWTGAPDLASNGTAQSTCAGWTSTAGTGIGALTSVGSDWFANGNLACNSTRARLYCVDCEGCP